MKLIAKYDPPKIEGLTIKEGKCAKNTFKRVCLRQNISEHVESKNSLFWKETEELLPSCKKKMSNVISELENTGFPRYSCF